MAVNVLIYFCIVATNHMPFYKVLDINVKEEIPFPKLYR